MRRQGGACGRFSSVPEVAQHSGRKPLADDSLVSAAVGRDGGYRSSCVGRTSSNCDAWSSQLSLWTWGWDVYTVI